MFKNHKMRKIILLFTILTINQCLETKFVKKTEFFMKDCNGALYKTRFERLLNECDIK